MNSCVVVLASGNPISTATRVTKSARPSSLMTVLFLPAHIAAGRILGIFTDSHDRVVPCTLVLVRKPFFEKRLTD